ncbi:HD domain-containing protein [Rhizobium brockwellii]|uniref:HD domain-containing protein n=1 Tax=Rhizobium brockwellii TaxID=3019932 RepID=A0ABU3YVZ0_9HYPH|nr:HD domain-containing protein [Rhizobium brockwellii]MDV4183124.1 HD domain-containing protein [Rhizobium brockwellii]MDV4189993.1 HD domain-containing protein [Rhizobium brockwellii]
MNFRTIIAATCATLAVFAGLTGLSKEGQAEPLVLETGLNTSNLQTDIPDNELTRDATRLVREAEGDFLFEHSIRVYLWAALTGRRKGLPFDPELLYVAALFHDFGLTGRYGQSHLRFEVDGANAARDFLNSHPVSEASSENIWLAIALHTTNGISANLSPTAALVAEGTNKILSGQATIVSRVPSAMLSRRLIHTHHSLRMASCKSSTRVLSIVQRRHKAAGLPTSWLIKTLPFAAGTSAI